MFSAVFFVHPIAQVSYVGSNPTGGVTFYFFNFSLFLNQLNSEIVVKT